MQAVHGDLTDKLIITTQCCEVCWYGGAILFHISGLNQFSFVKSGLQFFGVCVTWHGEWYWGSGNSNNVIMPSKACCIGLENWIYPVLAPRDQAAGISYGANKQCITQLVLLPTPPAIVTPLSRLKVKHVFPITRFPPNSSVTFLHNSGITIILTRKVNNRVFLIREVPGSNPGPWSFIVLPSPSKGRGLPCIRSRPVPPTSCPFHWSCHHSALQFKCSKEDVRPENNRCCVILVVKRKGKRPLQEVIKRVREGGVWGGGVTSKHNCLVSYLLCWRRHVSASVGQVTKTYIEENHTEYDHSVGAYCKLSTRSGCRLDYTLWAKSTSSK